MKLERKRKEITQDEYEILKLMYYSGNYTIKEICKKIGISYYMFRKTVKEIKL